MFRETALDRLSSPEELDQTIHITRPRSWLILIILTSLLVAALLWLIFAQVSTTLSATGAVVQMPGGAGVEALVYTNPTDESLLGPGAKVTLALRDPQSGRPVSLQGKVRSVAQYPADEKDMVRVVRSATLAHTLAVAHNFIPVYITLPSQQVGRLIPGASVRATFTIGEQTPIHLVIP